MDSDQYLRPPGCYDDLLAHPNGEDRSVEVAIVQDHRFAFYYWLKWNTIDEEPSASPTLASLDWHQDLTPPCDVECEELRLLDPSDFKEAALFCWDKLHCHNDGHILAAAYLNIIGNIHIVQKQAEPSLDEFLDRDGNPHAIHCHASIKEMMEALGAHSHPRAIFDIDLDYFTESEDDCGGGEDLELVPAADIQEMLRPDSALMQWIFPRIVGMTIATEPAFCGGIVNSNAIFDAVAGALFDPPLLSHSSGWKHLNNGTPPGQ